MSDDATTPTTTQPAPNISTEHQKPGDARRPGEAKNPSDEDAGTDTQPRPNISTER